MAMGLIVLTAYLIGSIPFGYLVARWRGVDIFRQGSGNIGATNVGRVLGRRFGFLVFALDFAKGALPVLATRRINLPPEDSFAESLGRDGLGVAAGLAAFVGHMFPVFLRFRGGKGVATGAGVVAVLLPGPALGAVVAWIALVAATRYVSLASLGAAATLCLVRLALTPEPFAGSNTILTLFCLVALALVVLRHCANIGRLVNGNENRLRETPAMFHLTKILHVLSVGLWFGTVVFFTFVVGLSLFGSFKELSAKPGNERPLWFPLPAAFDKPRPSDQFPDPLREEQGSRAAGAAVGPMFPWYYGIQGVCGLLALATAVGWTGARGGQKIRLAVLVLAVGTLAVGWFLEQKVEDLRVVRSNTSDEVLRSSNPTNEGIQKANDVRAQFGRWHGYSFMTNLATVLLVTVAMVLTASLPTTIGADDARMIAKL
jgi:acyl-phosphate glycerol 3-phosphate acyltransferase